MRIFITFFMFFSLVLAQGLFDENTTQPNKINIDDKIKAMIMTGLGKNADFSDLDYAGSVILFSRDFNTSSELKTLTDRLHSMSLKVAIDEEGGKVSRLAKIGFATPSAKELGAANEKTAVNAYLLMAQNLKNHGIDINFAPVVDLHDEKSPIIGALSRAFSNEPKQVAKMAHIFIAQHEKMGILTSLKHFVGHGNASVDTHKGGGSAKADRKALEPYRLLIGNGIAKSVMISHLKITNVDETRPASLSNAVINGLLRSKLHFDGLVFSDDMQMGALDEFSLEQKILGFIGAGGDVMIFSKYQDQKVSAKMVFDIIKKAVNSGKISTARINKSYDRIKKFM